MGIDPKKRIVCRAVELTQKETKLHAKYALIFGKKKRGKDQSRAAKGGRRLAAMKRRKTSFTYLAIQKKKRQTLDRARTLGK